MALLRILGHFHHLHHFLWVKFFAKNLVKAIRVCKSRHVGETHIPVTRLFICVFDTPKGGRGLGDIDLGGVLRQTSDGDNQVTGMRATRAYPNCFY